MDKDNKQWEKLISLPEEYEQNPELVEKAIAEIQSSKMQVKKNWFELHWKKVVACAASVALAIGVGLPLYKKVTAPPPVVYYAASDLITEDVLDVSTFVTEKELQVGFFNVPTVQTKAGAIKETEKIAVLNQKLVYISETGFDQIEFNVVLEKNLTLDFYEEYGKLQDEVTVGVIEVDYKTKITDNGLQQIFAKFTHENADYYLDVITQSEPTSCINTYVTMLVG